MLNMDFQCRSIALFIILLFSKAGALPTPDPVSTSLSQDVAEPTEYDSYGIEAQKFGIAVGVAAAVIFFATIAVLVIVVRRRTQRETWTDSEDSEDGLTGPTPGASLCFTIAPTLHGYMPRCYKPPGGHITPFQYPNDGNDVTRPSSTTTGEYILKDTQNLTDIAPGNKQNRTPHYGYTSFLPTIISPVTPSPIFRPQSGQSIGNNSRSSSPTLAESPISALTTSFKSMESHVVFCSRPNSPSLTPIVQIERTSPSPAIEERDQVPYSSTFNHVSFLSPPIPITPPPSYCPYTRFSNQQDLPISMTGTKHLQLMIPC
ncbi:hypothetical protein FRC18_009277 [Serendipita sp. 400]|nr:hypothetical protein FRC18_009277 [Serendipita sp. 400]